MDDKPHQQRFDAGLKTRRDVLGADYVDKSMSTTDDFNLEFQEEDRSQKTQVGGPKT